MKNFYFDRRDERPLETIVLQAADLPKETLRKLTQLRAGDKAKIIIKGKEFRLFQCLIGVKADKK